MDTRPRYTIGAVAQRTGLSAHVIRAWERRYEVVAPTRTEGGTRLYSAADILRLRLLRQATEGGLSIGNVAELPLAELIAISRPVEGGDESAASGVDRGGLSSLDAPILVAIEEMDTVGVQTGLRRALAYHGALEFIDRIALPLLRRVGELWEEATLCAAQEHLFSVQLRRQLEYLLESLRPPEDAPGLVATTFSGETHELGAMLAAVVAASEGWRVMYPGPDLPPGDIALAARISRADAVLISAVSPVSRRTLVAQSGQLVEFLPDSTSVIFGGPAAAGHVAALRAAGCTYLADLNALAIELRGLSRFVAVAGSDASTFAAAGS